MPDSKPPPPKKQAQSPRGEEPGLIPNHKVMPEVYFGDQTFWLRNDDGRFIAANTEVVRRRLKRRGFSGENTKSLNSEIDNILDDISNQHGVDYVGPLAGYDVGAHEILDTRVLVTRGPKIIEGNPDYSDDMVHSYIETLLGDESVYFHAWLKTVRENLKARTFRRTPVLVIAGEPDTGKSFLAKHVKTMIGGRVQDPTQFLQGKTTFNAHLFGAEFLLIDDAGGNADYARAQGDGRRAQAVGGRRVPTVPRQGADASHTPAVLVRDDDGERRGGATASPAELSRRRARQDGDHPHRGEGAQRRHEQD
jgi:hypothetical protein